MEENVKDIFNKTDCLGDLQKLVADSEDGESSWLEFKSLQKKGKKWGKNEFENHIKSLAAKEICAFLNTNDGILCLGIEYDNKEVSIVNEYSGDLYSFISMNIKDMVEPVPGGVCLKKIEGDDDQVALLIFVPRSNLLPHRVWGKAEGGIACNYYTRSDTDSIRLPEGLVRALYLSRGRVPRVQLYTSIEVLSANRILLKVIAKPDEAEYVESYYDLSRFMMLDGGGSLIKPLGSDSQWIDLGSANKRFDKPIYPARDSIVLMAHDITNDYSDDRGFLTGLLDDEMQYSPLADNTHLSIQDYISLQYILVESDFACSGVPLTRNRRLYVLPLGLGSEKKCGLNSSCGFVRNAKFGSLENKYGVEVFVSQYYDDDAILYSAEETATIMPSFGEISVSFIDNFLKNLEIQ